MTMRFEYWRASDRGEELVATGEHQAACMRRAGKKIIPVPVPAALQTALEVYLG